MASSKTASEIAAHGIGRTLADFHALSGVSLDIKRGASATLPRPSGPGRVTFPIILAGFPQASSRRCLSRDGDDIIRLAAEKSYFP